MTARSQSVPRNALKIYKAIVALTDTFCRKHLNEDYRELARDMTAALCRKRPSPVTSGQARTWACETVRFWWNRFGPIFAAKIRRKRTQSLRAFPQWR